jgi:catechol 2,3-dioxygenase-like lactoylglutathione lyase family enzyme
MKRIFLGMIAAVLATTGSASAQRAPFNLAGVTMGHWHMNSQNVEANKKLFVALGGKAIKPGDFEIVNFPGVSVFLHQRSLTPVATGGTAGTVINHVGLLVPNVQEAATRWKAAGVPVEFGKDPLLGKERTDQAWITTVDGLRVELLEDKAQTVPVRHHHVHFYVAEAAIPAIQAWYVKHFGAVAGMRGRDQAADLPGVNLTFTKSDTPTIPTRGRVLDHIGFDIKDLDAFAKKLEAAGVKLTRAVERRPDGSALAFTQDEWGTSIELNERPNPL